LNSTELPLSAIVDGTNRATAAAVFYQLLVLKTHKYIDLEQDSPYADITISTDEHFGAIKSN
jgi:chromatin segregation and condensation protein Rec8/ScpA/Scc1 (kleisin family)